MLLEIFNEWAKPELCIGSGIGSQLLKRAKRLAEDAGYVSFDGCRIVGDPDRPDDNDLDPYFAL
jgi:hypothetical protein